VSDARFVHALALGIDPAWRRLPAEERCRGAEELAAALPTGSEVTTFSYSTIGLEAGSDLLLWSLAPSLDALEERAAAVLRSALGGWLTVRESFLGTSRSRLPRSSRSSAASAPATWSSTPSPRAPSGTCRAARRGRES
jgi:chlorite dismutase